MTKKPLVLTVYSRTYQAANDDGLSNASCSTQLLCDPSETQASSGWDPFEVWRTRIRAYLKRDYPES